MCLGIPMKIIKIDGEFAEVESARLIRRISLKMLPQAKVCDYVIVHAGFAIERLDPVKARETLRLIDEIR